MNIIDIKNPKFLKKLNNKQLTALASDIREFLLNTISLTGGHLSSNLGVVELTIALHYVFDAPKDKILFDVGHQSYVHKILTGRASKMSTLRQFKGLAGFQKRKESEYDCFEAGHSSTALSTALGMAVGRDLNGDDYSIIPVVGDASMMSGMSLEALNQIGYEKKKIIIVFNDNNMSINKNVGALTKAFANLRNAKSYNSLKDGIKGFLKDKDYGKFVYSLIHNFKKLIKDTVIDSGVFKEFNIEYIGPIDGHDIPDLIRAFEVAKEKDIPCVVHCVTKKGKGYQFTENDTTGLWHGVGKFDISSGKFLTNSLPGNKTYSEIVANEVERNMDENKDIVCITPAMITGSKLNNIFAKYPDRSFDCGIAEDHAITFASGLALNGKLPFVAVYSSFLQRSYDQLNQELSRMNLPVVIGLDRAGLVGEDGETHHGVFDISFIRPLPNVILCEGKDSAEIEDLLFTGFKSKHPYFIRFPRGSINYIENHVHQEIPLGKWNKLVNNDNEKANILSYGNDIDIIASIVKENNLPYNVINCRFIKPIDVDMLMNIKDKPMFIYTTDILAGGLLDAVMECYNRNMIFNTRIYAFGIDDVFVQHGSVSKLKTELGIDINSFMEFVQNNVNA